MNSQNSSKQHAFSTKMLEEINIEDESKTIRGVASGNSNLTSSESGISDQKPVNLPKFEMHDQSQNSVRRTFSKTREVVFTLKKGEIIDPSVFDCNRIKIKANKLKSATIALINS